MTENEYAGRPLKEIVDYVGYVEMPIDDYKFLCEFERIRDKYIVRYYTQRSPGDLELVKTYRLDEFPDESWLRKTLEQFIMCQFGSIFGI